MSENNNYIPKWFRELEIFEKIKPIIILEGNVLDKFQYPAEGDRKGSIIYLPECLYFHYSEQGYSNIVFYDSIRGFYNNIAKDSGDMMSRFCNLVGLEKDTRRPPSFKGKERSAPCYVREALSQNKEATVIVMDFASRYISSPSNMDQTEIDSFTILLQAAMDSGVVASPDGVKRNNLLIILANKINDIPVWFYLDNPNIKTILLKTPSREEREQMVIGTNFRAFFAKDIYDTDSIYFKQHPDELKKLQERFVGLTEGFTFIEMNGLRNLAKERRIHIKDICDVIDLYKFGIKENPWKALNRDDIKNAYKTFHERVLGQDAAIAKTLDVIKCAVTGLSGIESSSGTRPKGVLFFAGPTGTGKTETAKTLAQLIFGDERNCIRFDMSEYSQSHSDQKLLGAPPGYVGYEAGGQLTNAVKNNPFSILLFDEIEKASPTILDKFLQILDDGRMTDGQGNTVYFSETVIIFTSNLGIYEYDSEDKRRKVLKVRPSENTDEEVQKIVRKGVEDYFKLELGRPEILNRIGENVVVFNFIREDTSKKIMDMIIDNKIAKNLLMEKKIVLDVEPMAREKMLEHVNRNLENGGRGIRNIVESLLTKPLGRFMFDEDIDSNKKICVNDIKTDVDPVELDCTVLDI